MDNNTPESCQVNLLPILTLMIWNKVMYSHYKWVIFFLRITWGLGTERFIVNNAVSWASLYNILPEYLKYKLGIFLWKTTLCDFKAYSALRISVLNYSTSLCKCNYSKSIFFILNNHWVWENYLNRTIKTFEKSPD